ncbi:PREDICTED: uncharacterized protein LOC104731280 [Camelina sativa]|uniref:Uncharacterized protein LOC104731280 n=1 Tax=Camelina sativa TaxID=90675 RepID=A0ABM0V0C2_CAMSA|nr:PREDICTED: uncharacterized protein LOC104731280 [Camelina sativa]
MFLFPNCCEVCSSVTCPNGIGKNYLGVESFIWFQLFWFYRPRVHLLWSSKGDFSADLFVTVSAVSSVSGISASSSSRLSRLSCEAPHLLCKRSRSLLLCRCLLCLVGDLFTVYSSRLSPASHLSPASRLSRLTSGEQRLLGEIKHWKLNRGEGSSNLHHQTIGISR